MSRGSLKPCGLSDLRVVEAEAVLSAPRPCVGEAVAVDLERGTGVRDRGGSDSLACSPALCVAAAADWRSKEQLVFSMSPKWTENESAASVLLSFKNRVTTLGRTSQGKAREPAVTATRLEDRF